MPLKLNEPSPAIYAVPTLRSLCNRALEKQFLKEQTKSFEHSPSGSTTGDFHVTAEIEERPGYKTPENEISDFDDDDDIADPDYVSDEESGEESDDKEDRKSTNFGDNTLDPNENQNGKNSRKRKRNKQKWKKNITKQKRLSGLEYTYYR